MFSDADIQFAKESELKKGKKENYIDRESCRKKLVRKVTENLSLDIRSFI